ncbi:CBM9 family sugar-binding protein [Paenibacillus sabuli]|nr:CBM9 family sugar-binding protein [Paenibacillus sabuli]
MEAVDRAGNTAIHELEVTVDLHKVNDSARGYEDDSVEIYLDGNNARSGTYNSDDHQLTLGWQNETLSVGADLPGIMYAQQDNPDGYTVEFAIPWQGIGIDPPAIGDLTGFELVTARYQGTPQFVVLGSTDGTSYTALGMTTTTVSAGQGFAVQRHVQAGPLPADIRYLKVQFPDGANWHAYVNRVAFTYMSE